MSTDEQVERFDVAITFAGEDRAIAEKIRQGLIDRGLRVFYDEDFKVEMWGKNLIDFLSRVYSREAAFALMLISRSYVDKHWTNLERRSAQDRALTESREYILPVRLDDAEVPGMPSSTGYLDARIEGIAGIVDAVLAKVNTLSVTADAPAAIYEGDVPSTPAAFSSLLALRPPGWEYLLFAGRLREELNSHRDGYLDFQLKYTSKVGPRLDWDDGFDYISDACDRFVHASEQVGSILTPEVQDAAFGIPGEPGDIGRISHLASRISAMYVSFMETSAELRAARFPGEHLAAAAHVVADYAIQPVDTIRKLSDDLCESLKDLPRRLRDGETVRIVLDLTPEVPDELTERFRAELAGARVEYGAR